MASSVHYEHIRLTTNENELLCKSRQAFDTVTHGKEYSHNLAATMKCGHGSFSAENIDANYAQVLHSKMNM